MWQCDNVTQNKIPVVKAGVHSCSPVAPHRYVKLLAGVPDGPATAVWKIGVRLLGPENLRYKIRFNYIF